MTRETIKGLLIAMGLALLTLFSVILPLCAAPSQYPQPQETGDVELGITAAPSTTVTAGQPLTLTATLRNNRPISITDVNLTFTLPLTTITSTIPLIHEWASIEPTTTVTHAVPLRVPDQVSGTLWFTVTLQYAITETLSSSDSIKIVMAPPETTAVPAATATPPPAPLSTPTEVTVPTSAPIATSAPITTPIAVPKPTATFAPFGKAMAFVSENRPLFAAICILPLLVLGLLLILWIFRRKKHPKPATSPLNPTPLLPVPTTPYLESIGLPGGPHYFNLKPDGVTIGRVPENDLVITQEFPGWESTSRRHARVYQQAGNWIVEDLRSMNGVYVNGKRTGRNLLRDGWRLGIGRVGFVFHTGASGEVQR